jgi:hypothetical protein
MPREREFHLRQDALSAAMKRKHLIGSRSPSGGVRALPRSPAHAQACAPCVAARANSYRSSVVRPSRVPPSTSVS